MPIASFTLPQEPAQVDLVGVQFAEPSASVRGNSPPIAKLTVNEPMELPAVDGRAFSPRPRQRALIALDTEGAIDRSPKPSAVTPGGHSSAERNTARAVAAAFAHAFPVQFAPKDGAARFVVPTPQTGADLTSSAEPGDATEVFATQVPDDPVEPDRRGQEARGTELPGLSNSAQQNGTPSMSAPIPSNIGVEAPVERSGAVIGTADQVGLEAAPVTSRHAVTVVAAVRPKVQHTAKLLPAAEPLAVWDVKRAKDPAVGALEAARHKGSLLILPHGSAAQRAAITHSLAPDLVAAGQIHDGHVAVRLGNLLDAFEPVMDRAEFEWLSRSPHTAELLTLTTLRGAGIPVHYDAADRTVAAAGGVRISAATLA